MTDERLVVVVTDATVLINLIHTRRLGLLARLPPLRFVVPEDVQAEVIKEDQPQQLSDAVAAGHLEVCAITDLIELALFAELRAVLGAGESACLALAQSRSWMVASDDGRPFRTEAIARLGEHRLLTTPTIYVRAIQAGLLSVPEADADKAVLASKRFIMPFQSFAELLRSA